MSSHPRPWKLLDTEHLQDCKVFSVARMRSRSPYGNEHDFFRIDSTDWVNVVPVTEAGEIIMVRQFRHGSQRVTLEIPGGMIDAGEDAGTVMFEFDSGAAGIWDANRFNEPTSPDAIEPGAGGRERGGAGDPLLGCAVVVSEHARLPGND